MKEQTLLLIKPNATEKNLIGRILNRMEENHFRIKDLKLFRMDHAFAEVFYEMHIGKPFYDKLCDFMMSGVTVAAVLEKENAISDLRLLLGNTDPAKANPGTIRYLFGESVTINAVHGSDSPENAEREIKLVFNK